MNGKKTTKDVLYIGADTALRLGLGVMFIFSAWSKILDPRTFQTMVDNYRMLPSCVTAIFAVTMSAAELIVGAMFLFTKWTREAAFATGVMLVMFVIALAQAQIRGLDISCGCFGDTEHGANVLLTALVRDILLAAPTFWLMVKGQRRWIADFRQV